MQNPDRSGAGSALARGTIGAILGAAVGSAIFIGLVNLGLYALIAPGALTGIGASRFARVNSPVVGVICTVVAVVATVLCEWSQFPFLADGSLLYFITHLHQLRSMAMLLGGIGIVAAFVFGKGSQPAI